MEKGNYRSRPPPPESLCLLVEGTGNEKKVGNVERKWETIKEFTVLFTGWSAPNDLHIITHDNVWRERRRRRCSGLVE